MRCLIGEERSNLFSSGTNFLLPYSKGFGGNIQFRGNELTIVLIVALCLACLLMSFSTRTKVRLFGKYMVRIKREGKLNEWCADNLKYLADTFGKKYRCGSPAQG